MAEELPAGAPLGQTALCVLGGIREPISMGQRVQYLGGKAGEAEAADKLGDCLVVSYNVEDQTSHSLV